MGEDGGVGGGGGRGGWPGVGVDLWRGLRWRGGGTVVWGRCKQNEGHHLLYGAVVKVSASSSKGPRFKSRPSHCSKTAMW